VPAIPFLALSGVETVGLWVGLISAVVSIVLSVVAILFARDVDRRSMEINSQTIRSLEAIQSTVQRLSDDTGGLIKVAWERMLGTMEPGGSAVNRDVEGILSGLLHELRQDADDLAPESGVGKLVQDADRRLRRATSRRGVTDRVEAPKGLAFDAAVEAIEAMSPLAIELLRALEGGPSLTRGQYQQLRRDPQLALAIDELRDGELLMPFQHRDANGEETVYGITPWLRDMIGPALVFTDHEAPSSTEAQYVRRALQEAGYPVDELSEPITAVTN
jgi:hypothetical protein